MTKTFWTILLLLITHSLIYITWHGPDTPEVNPSLWISNCKTQIFFTFWPKSWKNIFKLELQQFEALKNLFWSCLFHISKSRWEKQTWMTTEFLTHNLMPLHRLLEYKFKMLSFVVHLTKVTKRITIHWVWWFKIVWLSWWRCREEEMLTWLKRGSWTPFQFYTRTHEGSSPPAGPSSIKQLQGRV